MCPACLTTVALMIAGATSTGGLTLLAAKKLRARLGAGKPDPKTKPTEMEPCSTTVS